MKQKTARAIFMVTLFSALILSSPRLAIGQATRAGEIKGLKNEEVKSNAKSYFIENKGQWDSKALYLSQSKNMDLWLTKNSIVYDLYGQTRGQKQTGDVIEMRFVGSNEPKITALVKQDFYHNYFTSKNGELVKVTNVGIYNEVTLENIYDKVSARYYRADGKTRYDIILQSGANPSKIKLAFEGKKSISLFNDGLKIYSKNAVLSQAGLFAYQRINGENVKVLCRFKQNSDGSIGFNLGNYDNKLPLVIDPLLSSTFLGGSDDDIAYSVANDGQYNSYMCGSTISPSFPTTSGSYDVTKDKNYDVFITKFSTVNQKIVYSTFVGGNSSENGYGIIVDNNGDAFVTGSTTSSNFPVTTNAYDKNQNGGIDAFAFKLSPTGSDLIYSTFVGGIKDDEATCIAIDKSNAVYIVGKTNSDDFPTYMGYDNSYNGGVEDGFVTKINPSGSSIVYSSYLGGSDRDIAQNIKVINNEAVVSGSTYSKNFPTSNGAFDVTHNGYSDAFITRLNSSGNNINYSTFIGGDGYDESKGLLVDEKGYAYLCGKTTSTNFPVTAGALDKIYNGGDDAFIARINSNASALVYATYFGGSSDEIATGLNFDNNGNIYFIGQTKSADLPITSDAFRGEYSGGYDGFIAKIDSNGSDLKYSTFYGGTKDEYLTAILTDACGVPTIVGYTNSDNFPTTKNSFDDSYNGEFDAFISNLHFGSLELTSPQPGEHICPTKMYEIRWTSHNVANVRIELSSDGGKTFASVIAASVAGDEGLYRWAIPISQSGGNNFKIRILDACSNNLADTTESGVFIDEPIKVVASPLGRNGCQGDSIRLNVRATGSELKYQWRRNGENIEGATDSTFLIKSAAVSDEGKYDVVINNQCGTDTSEIANVGVMITPVITEQMVDKKVCQNQAMTLSVGVKGSGVSYQWRKNGGILAGAKDSIFTIKSVKPSDAGKYDVLVVNGCGASIISNPAIVTVGNVKIDAPSVVDFGKVTSDLPYKEIDFTVKNSGTDIIQIVRTQALQEPFVLSLVSPQLPANIAANQTLTLRVRYTKALMSGSYNDTLRLITASPCNGIVNIPIKVSVGEIVDTTNQQGVRIQLPKMDVSVKQYNPVYLPIVYANPSEKPEGATSLELYIAFNPQALMPADLNVYSTVSETMKKDSSVMRVKIDNVPTSGSITRVAMYPLLTSVSSSIFKVVDFRWEGVSPVTSFIDGEIKMKDVCNSGGIRDVFMPDSVGPKLLKITPNPASNNVKIDFIPTESGETVFSLYNVNGLEVANKTDIVDLSGSQLIRSVVFDVSNFPTGLYFLVARTHNGVARELISVVK